MSEIVAVNGWFVYMFALPDPEDIAIRVKYPVIAFVAKAGEEVGDVIFRVDQRFHYLHEYQSKNPDVVCHLAGPGDYVPTEDEMTHVFKQRSGTAKAEMAAQYLIANRKAAR